MNQNAFLLLYLLPVEECRRRLGFRAGQILGVPGNPARTLGGVHILLIDGKNALMTFLPGYGEWEGERGFWTTSCEPTAELRYRRVKEGKRFVFMFETGSHAGVFMTIRPGISFPLRKRIPFLDHRGGMVSFRSDLGSFFAMVSLKVQWPKPWAPLFATSIRVLGCGYASSTVTVRPVVPRNSFEYLPGRVLSGDMREIRTQSVHHEGD